MKRPNMPKIDSKKSTKNIGRLFVANFTFCPKNIFIFLAATDIFVLLHNIGNFIPSHFWGKIMLNHAPLFLSSIHPSIDRSKTSDSKITQNFEIFFMVKIGSRFILKLFLKTTKKYLIKRSCCILALRLNKYFSKNVHGTSLKWFQNK